MKVCSVDGCAGVVSAKGLCNKHYQRMVRGVPAEGNPKKSVLERISQKINVDPDTGCFIWTGAVAGGNKGVENSKYGYIRINGKSLRVHRFYYELINGPIPDGMVICHRCDNRLCINPEHLFPGTQADNLQDMVEKGRDSHPRGEDNNSKLTESEVFSIREQAEKGASLHELSAKYGVHVVTVRNIVKRKKWAHL